MEETLTTKRTINVIAAVVVAAVVIFLWLRWGPDSWDVQISGVTGDGRNVQYRIETVRSGTADTLIFRNEDAGFFPPYFKFDSATLQARAGRISRECPDVPVTMNGYSFRLPWLDMFPNATSVDAPERCLTAVSKPEDTKGSTGN
jgi:hypothetical protein